MGREDAAAQCCGRQGVRERGTARATTTTTTAWRLVALMRCIADASAAASPPAGSARAPAISAQRGTLNTLSKSDRSGHTLRLKEGEEEEREGIVAEEEIGADWRCFERNTGGSRRSSQLKERPRPRARAAALGLTQ